MIILEKKELENISIELNGFSALAVALDESLSKVLKEMQPQFAHDNFGTENFMATTAFSTVLEGMDYLDKVSEYALGLKAGIDNIIKTV